MNWVNNSFLFIFSLQALSIPSLTSPLCFHICLEAPQESSLCHSRCVQENCFSLENVSEFWALVVAMILRAHLQQLYGVVRMWYENEMCCVQSLSDGYTGRFLCKSEGQKLVGENGQDPHLLNPKPGPRE